MTILIKIIKMIIRNILLENNDVNMDQVRIIRIIIMKI